MKLVNGTAYMYAVRNCMALDAPLVCVTRDQALAFDLARAINPQRLSEGADEYAKRIVGECVQQVACVESEDE